MFNNPQVDILELLAQQGEDHWLPWQQKRPLLHIACERAAWNCVKYLVSERSDEINQCYDEYYPIHHAALHDIKFLELLIQCGAETTVRTSTQLMTALHVVRNYPLFQKHFLLLNIDIPYYYLVVKY